MQDPLTPLELEELLQNFRKEFISLYQNALKSGALSELEEHDYNLARCVLIIAANNFKPFNKTGKKMLRNLEKFIG